MRPTLLLMAMAFLACPAMAAEPPPTPSSDASDSQVVLKRWTMDNVGYGLLRLPSQSPFQALRLALLPRTPSTLDAKSWEFRFTQNLSNTWVNEENRYLLDYETLHSKMSVSHRFHEILYEVSFEERRLLNGMLDGYIKTFHDTFNLDQDGRDKAPYGEVQVDIQSEDGSQMVQWEGGKGAFSQNLSLVMQHNLTKGNHIWPAFSYSLTINYGIWDAFDMEKDFPVDVGGSFSMAKRIGKLHGYLVPGFFWYGSTGMGDIRFERTQVSCLAGLEWRFHESVSLLVQYLYSEGACKNLGSFTDPSHELTLGLKGRLTNRLVWELGLLENIITYDNSPDFGVHWGLTFRL